MLSYRAPKIYRRTEIYQAGSGFEAKSSSAKVERKSVVTAMVFEVFLEQKSPTKKSGGYSIFVVTKQQIRWKQNAQVVKKTMVLKPLPKL